MFTLNGEKTKILSDSEDKVVRQEKGEANIIPRVKVKNMIIHCSGGLSLPRAVNHYLTSASSRHLLIEQNGMEIVQMVDFNKGAIHADGFNNNSLGIELIYPGYLIDRLGFPNSKNRFSPLEMINAHSVNDPKVRWWPLFPQSQLDTLLEIARTLNQEFRFEGILAKDEIDRNNLRVGPAFPRNRLRQLLAKEGDSADLLEETREEAVIFNQPGGVGLKMIDQPLPSHTPIVVLEESGGWVLVEVMDTVPVEVSGTVEEFRWLVGWIDAKKVKIPDFTPSVNDEHLLTAGIANRRIKFVEPARNNFNPDVKLNPQFVVIHFTTGTDFQSTIHHFRNPNSGVSTHLLIARSGQVIQFVPFNQLAFHVGPSYWEGERNLNRLAIGIEVDNAGYLKPTRANGFTSQYGAPIPREQVKTKIHWKEDREKHWQRYSKQQIQVVTKIVRALKEKYPSIREVVGHDMVNLVNRLDPGPLFPLGELRKEILGDSHHKIEKCKISENCPVYENIDDHPPHNLQHPEHGTLPKNSKVRVREGEMYQRWTKVLVKSSNDPKFNNKEGWLLSNSLVPDGRTHKTKVDQHFFEVIPAVSPRFPPVVIRNLGGEDIVLRKLFLFNDQWALVAPVLEEFDVMVENDDEIDDDDIAKLPKIELRITEDMQKLKFDEGWIEKKFLTNL